MAPRLSEHSSIFDVVYFVSKPLLGIERQKKLLIKKIQFWPESLEATLECWYIGRGLLFRCLFYCSLEKNRVIPARPYEGSYMILNNEVVIFIYLSCYYHQSTTVFMHLLVTSVSHSSTKEQKHGTGILHNLKLGVLVEYNK